LAKEHEERKSQPIKFLEKDKGELWKTSQ
jgi:hypothetical protein